jgi:ribosomal protein L44E
LLKIKNSNRKLFKAHCRQLLERENNGLKKQLKLERKKIRKTKEKISIKYKCLRAKVCGMDIDYQMYRKLLNSIVSRDQLKKDSKDIDFNSVRFITFPLNLEETKKDIVKYFTPLIKKI